MPLFLIQSYIIKFFDFYWVYLVKFWFVCRVTPGWSATSLSAEVGALMRALSVVSGGSVALALFSRTFVCFRLSAIFVLLFPSWTFGLCPVCGLAFSKEGQPHGWSLSFYFCNLQVKFCTYSGSFLQMCFIRFHRNSWDSYWLAADLFFNFMFCQLCTSSFPPTLGVSLN